jgi:hypothetical protein
MNKQSSRVFARTTKSLIFATAVALIALFAGVASAKGGGGSGGVGLADGSGGTGTGGGHSSGGACPKARFGSRTLKRGDCGDDVKTLNWILKAQASRAVDLDKDFSSPTASAVKSFERTKHQQVNGVVEKTTRQALVGSLPSGTATWYGPTLYGNGVACGGTLRRGTIGVAHKTLPCGTKVLVGYKGHWVRTKVIDRGPYGTHAQWDLTEKTAEKLHFKSAGIGKIKFATIKK